MRINETVLEMHFHSEIINLVKKKLGLGPGAKFNFYKYSPQHEKFVGFDQAFVMTQLPDDVLFKQLKNSASNTNYNMGAKFVGLFLQFKVVQKLDKKSKKNPPPVSSSPYYRVNLYTSRNSANEKSQHELLYQLAKNNVGAFVYYACPMVFDKVMLYTSPNLNDLRLAKLNTCPGPYTDNDKHFIFYDTPSSAPIWKSEPVTGEAISPENMATAVAFYLRDVTPATSLENLRNLLSDFSYPVQTQGVVTESVDNLLVDALTILSIEE